VANEIDILPLSPMDNRFRLAEFRAFYRDRSLSTCYGYRSIPHIHIIVKNGHVTLEGVVANESDRNIGGVR
jgi:hyperosmotically inducible periplasmic protein